MQQPNQLGAPTKFSHWWEGQEEALQVALTSTTRFTALCLPTGAGKTLIYTLAAIRSGMRAAILTSTKALQDQIYRDWGDRLYDMRGMNNYACKPLIKGGEFYVAGVADWKQRCDSGPCKSGYHCEHRDLGCSYFDSLAQAKDSRIVSTNYSYWMASSTYSQGLGARDLLIVDEAHKAPEELSKFTRIKLTATEIEGLLGDRFRSNDDPNEWAGWAADAYHRVCKKVAELTKETKTKNHYSQRLGKELSAYTALKNKLMRVTLIDDDWVVTEGKPVIFDPIFPRKQNEFLFQGVEKVILTSATIRPKTCDLLGIKKNELTFYEAPSTFPIERRPFIHIPTIKLTHRSTPAELRQWVIKIDQILSKREGRKGVIHTVSYRRADYLLQRSRHRDRMLSHDTRSAPKVVSEFKRSTGDCVLVSPSATTGYDFPYGECRFQIITKVPFPDMRSKVLRARCEKDKDYAMYLAMQDLVQASGRGMRAPDDYCETFIVDDSISWFLFKYKDFAPEWFVDSYKKVRVIPDGKDRS